MKDIREEFAYDQPVETVFALIATGAFQLEIIAHLGGHEGQVVDEAAQPGGGTRLVTRQKAGVELPGFVKKLVPDNTVTQTYDWEGPGGDGGRRGTWKAEIKGAPVTLGGATELRPSGTGCVHVFTGQVKASVPVVGGRLESFALDNLRRELARTAEFTRGRLE